MGVHILWLEEIELLSIKEIVIVKMVNMKGEKTLKNDEIRAWKNSDIHEKVFILTAFF